VSQAAYFDTRPTDALPWFTGNDGISSRLSRHEKQAVRRFIRERGRIEHRAYRTHGTAIGVRDLIIRANRRMARGREVTIAYPQDIGCGMRSVEQILRERA
jgi:hypothetical protein